MESIQDILLLFAKRARKLMGKELSKILVYGSYARGDYNENSDIDIMILTPLSDEKIEEVEYQGTQTSILNRKSFFTTLSYGWSSKIIGKALKGELNLEGDTIIFNNVVPLIKTIKGNLRNAGNYNNNQQPVTVQRLCTNKML